MCQQRGNEFLLFDAAGLGLEHQTYGGVFVRLVPHDIQHRQHARLELVLVLRQSLLAGLDLGVGQLLNFFEHPLTADTRGQLGHHQLPLAARQIFNLPARAHLQRTSAGAVRVSYVHGAADDLPATGKIGARYQRGKCFVS